MLPALMFHFILTLVRSRPKRVTWIRLPYLLSGVFAFNALSAMFHPGSRWFMDSGLRNVLFLILLGPVLFIGIGVVLLAIRRTKLEDERERLRYILIAGIIGVLTGLTETCSISEGTPSPGTPRLPCLFFDFGGQYF